MARDLHFIQFLPATVRRAGLRGWSRRRFKHNTVNAQGKAQTNIPSMVPLDFLSLKPGKTRHRSWISYPLAHESRIGEGVVKGRKPASGIAFQHATHLTKRLDRWVFYKHGIRPERNPATTSSIVVRRGGFLHDLQRHALTFGGCALSVGPALRFHVTAQIAAAGDNGPAGA